MFCPNCGTKNEDGAKFCQKCGEPLKRRAESGAPEPQQAPAPRPASKPQPTSQPQPAQTSAPQSKVAPKAARPKWLIPALAGALGLVLIVVVAVVVFKPASGGGPAPAPQEGTVNQVVLDDGSWTILNYMCGSNLETDDGCATLNLEEILSVDLPDNVNMLIETGGSSAWQNDIVDPEYLEYYVVQDQGLLRKEQRERKSMGDPDVLADFVKWGVENYPAQHYVLLFWDHGGGSITGVCLDQLDDDGLSLPEMDQALSQVGAHFDIVGFDTCVMATLENAQMLADHSDYMVASEEVIPFGGWAYDKVCDWFNTTDDTNDVVDFCRTIVDTYMDKCQDNGVADSATLSVVDLTRLGGLNQAFGDAAEAMARSTERAGNMQHLVVEGDAVEAYGFANYVSGYLDMVDLGDLLSCMSDTLVDESKAVHDALDDVVVYEQHGATRSRATGVSVFYPLNIDEDTYEQYKTICEELSLNNDAYLQYLAVRTGAYDASEWQGRGIEGLDPVTEDDAKGAFKYEGVIDERGAFQVKITGNTEFVQVATYQFGQVQPDGTVVPLGTGNYLDVEINDKGEITYTDQFAGEVLNIGGAYAYAEIVDMVQEDGKASYNLFSVPIELTRAKSSGDTITIETNLLVLYDYDTREYSMVCYYEDVDESGMAGKSIEQLRVGDQLKFLVAREVNGEVQRGSTGTITLANDTTAQVLAPTGETSYVYQIVITDIFGQQYEPVSALISFKDAKRTGAKLI